MTPRANVDTVARSGLDILKKVPLFKGLADEQLAELSSVFQRSNGNSIAGILQGWRNDLIVVTWR